MGVDHCIGDRGRAGFWQRCRRVGSRVRSRRSRVSSGVWNGRGGVDGGIGDRNDGGIGDRDEGGDPCLAGHWRGFLGGRVGYAVGRRVNVDCLGTAIVGRASPQRSRFHPIPAFPDDEPAPGDVSDPEGPPLAHAAMTT